MRRVIVIAVLLLGCSTERTAGPILDPVASNPANAITPPEDKPKPKPKLVMRAVIDEKCLTKASCKKGIPGAGRAWAQYFKNVEAQSSGMTLSSMSPNGFQSLMTGGYAMACTSFLAGWRCTLKYLGAVALTAIVPEACATVVGA